MILQMYTLIARCGVFPQIGFIAFVVSFWDTEDILKAPVHRYAFAYGYPAYGASGLLTPSALVP